MTIRLDQRYMRAPASRADHVNAGVAAVREALTWSSTSGQSPCAGRVRLSPAPGLHTERDLTLELGVGFVGGGWHHEPIRRTLNGSPVEGAMFL